MQAGRRLEERGPGHGRSLLLLVRPQLRQAGYVVRGGQLLPPVWRGAVYARGPDGDAIFPSFTLDHP